MLGRQPRSCLELLKPDLEQAVYKKQDIQKRIHDKTVSNRIFGEGEVVYAKNYSSLGSLWLSGKVVKLAGPVSVEVKLEDGSIIRHHFDQLRRKARSTAISPEEATITDNSVETNESDDYLTMSVPSPDQSSPNVQGVSTDNHREQSTPSSELVL